MKHRNNYTYKIQYLDEIRHSGRTPSSEELVKMYRMSQDKSSTIRCALTQALVNRYTPESEKVLRIMADDKNGLVRVNAIDSLGIGREEESVEFLMERMNRKYSKMESGYAALSYFDVYINRYGYNEKSVREYLENVRELYSQEDRSWVIVCYETNRYLAGEADALDQLFTFFKEENGKDSSVQRAAATSIRDRVNIFNKDEIKRRLEEIGSERAKREVKQIEDEKIMPKILILSEENVGMSHFLEYLGKCEEEWPVTLESAGIHPGEKINGELLELLEQEDDFDLTEYQYPKPVMKPYWYDYILPVGIKVNPADYPFQRIIPLFEEVEENQVDRKKAEAMLDELKKYLE